MPRLLILALAFALFAVSASRNAAAEEAKSKTAEFMTKYFKGKESFVAKTNAGTVDEAALKAFVEGALALQDEKPPVGEAAAYKKKIVALADAGKALLEKKEGAPAAFKEATDCKACHSVFRPKKPQ